MDDKAEPNETEILYERVPEAAVLTEPLDRYRYIVGMTVQTLAEVDYLLANIIAEAVPTEDGGDTFWGQSGTQLIEGLDLAVARAGSETAALLLIRHMYGLLYAERNDVVHGMYHGPNGPGSDQIQTIRPERASRKTPGLRHLPKLWETHQLASLAQDARGLVDDAVIVLSRLQYERTTGASSA